jgi:hypothetical protein
LCRLIRLQCVLQSQELSLKVQVKLWRVSTYKYLCVQAATSVSISILG